MGTSYETRFTSSRVQDDLEQDRQAAARRHRIEMTVVIALLAVTGGIVVWWTILNANNSVEGPSRNRALFRLAILLGVESVFGMVALCIAAKYWLGGVGPLGSTTLRLLALVTTLHLAVMMLGGNPFALYTLIVIFAIGSGLAAWLFHIDIVESAATLAIAIVMIMVADFALSAFVELP